MSPEDRDRHRSRIGLEVEIAFNALWRADDPPHVRAGVLADFADYLEDWPLENIRWGLREWRKDHPKHRPHPEQVAEILQRRRGIEVARRLPPPAPEPERIIADGETRARILTEAGLDHLPSMQARRLNDGH